MTIACIQTWELRWTKKKIPNELNVELKPKNLLQLFACSFCVTAGTPNPGRSFPHWLAPIDDSQACSVGQIISKLEGDLYQPCLLQHLEVTRGEAVPWPGVAWKAQVEEESMKEQHQPVVCERRNVHVQQDHNTHHKAKLSEKPRKQS